MRRESRVWFHWLASLLRVLDLFLERNNQDSRNDFSERTERRIEFYYA
jgi:hypothetical protein